MVRADVALLTEARYAGADAPEHDWYFQNILRDDALLQAALLERGLSSARVDWADPHVDWTRFRCALFRTTWDYFHRFPEFQTWLRRIETRTRLCNPPELVWWNLDKHYLADLESRGVPVVPTRFLERGEPVVLRSLLREIAAPVAVIKPCVSGSARHTYRVDDGNADALQPLVDGLLLHESLMLQPFIDDVVTNGEDTLVMIGGQFTHAVRKRPKAGDFRVQDDHGGTVTDHVPGDDQIDLARRAIAACSPRPVYGRVDMVRDALGNLAVMELELIEPELWLRHHPSAATKLAAAVRTFLEPP
jgi:glutathione synthase/RimK-type ligase-like ATP-grasp enzyme